MRSFLATVVCVLAILVGCASEPPAPKDPKLQAREAYFNALADGAEREAQALREQADALTVKAKEKELKAKELRRNARDAAAGKIPEEPEPENH